MEPKKENNKLTKYDFGINFEPANNSYVALKHETIPNDEKVALGKFFLYFYHVASTTNTVGSEFALNWQTKKVNARLGLLHKFSDDVTSKLRLNDEGKVDGVLKYKISDSVTASVTSGLSVKNITDAKSGALPLGV